MNPKLDFYSALLTACSGKVFLKEAAQKAVDLYEKHPGEITLSDVTLENIQMWHEQMTNYTSGEDPGIERAEEITVCLFADLAVQMRNEPVRDLLCKWKTKAGILDDLFIYVRRSKDLGDGAATITLVTDDIIALREFFADPDEFIRMRGEVHFSEAEEAKDPV